MKLNININHETVQDAISEVMVQEAVLQLQFSILDTMREDRRGLEAAIESSREKFRVLSEAEAGIFPPGKRVQMVAISMTAHQIAEDRVRKMIETARDMVTAADLNVADAESLRNLGG